MLVVCLIFILAGCENNNSTPPHDFGSNDPNLYVACGDSITEGDEVGVTPGGYPVILASMLGKTVINQGYGGDTTISGIDVVGTSLADYKPGYVLILFGANDVIHSFDTNTTIQNLQIMIEAAKNNNTIPVVGTVMPMSLGHAIFEGGVEQLNPEIIKLADREGIAVADLWTAFGNNPDLIIYDGLHPTDAGNQVIATTFYNALK
jgi:lysophospholipase L1-like esterase